MRSILGGWVAANPAARGGGLIAAVLLAVSGLFGGLDRAKVADRVDDVAPNSAVTVQPFTLTFKQAVALDEIEDVTTPRTPGNHLMVLLLDAENLTDASVGAYLLSPVPRAKSFMNRNVVVLDDRLSPDLVTVYDAESHIPLTQLSPGLTYRLAVVWEFGGAVPDRLPLGLAALTLRGNTISPDDLGWQNPAEAAMLTLAVNDLTSDRT
ncbi:hypothetical protein SAMN04489835_3938 [Mycolicibacterium rutilum]|uniref:Uncharacterized protein n=1 Tax=Mycolicibacterium rutilum TaxID=370526 RepID=A0A1H6KW62_MYCRU|nr:hypothetical protein [Mycolicibacterium rutilum]SEH77181.1 hypothetical protein SAMN04489835_3938 [Mycolicibacterium rutilum]